LEQIAKDKSVKTGTKVLVDDLQNLNNKSIPEKFKEIYEKMDKIYPLKSAHRGQLQICLNTIKRYVCKIFFSC
jgi:hypothetical protein